LSVGGDTLTSEMSRHVTFIFCLDPTVEQQQVLARHAGAARFAFNRCLQMVKTALTQRKTDNGVMALWTGFDLINGWKQAPQRPPVRDPGGQHRVSPLHDAARHRRDWSTQ
jgi:hypothetical protein